MIARGGSARQPICAYRHDDGTFGGLQSRDQLREARRVKTGIVEDFIEFIAQRERSTHPPA